MSTTTIDITFYQSSWVGQRTFYNGQNSKAVFTKRFNRPPNQGGGKLRLCVSLRFETNAANWVSESFCQKQLTICLSSLSLYLS